MLDFDMGMIWVPVLSIVILFILTKIMGYRQITQLSMYDYIIGITIGSIAGELITIDYDDVLRPILGMVIYTAFTIFLSWVCRKNATLRKFIDGQAVILYENDCLYNKELAKAKLDIDEFLMQCRVSGYFNLQELDKIILETNGTLSFLPKEKNRPVQVSDLNGKVQDAKPPMILVKEGNINQDNLKQVNKDTQWLENTLKNANVPLDKVLLMYQEDNSNVQIFPSNTNTKKYD